MTVLCENFSFFYSLFGSLTGVYLKKINCAVGCNKCLISIHLHMVRILLFRKRKVCVFRV